MKYDIVQSRSGDYMGPLTFIHATTIAGSGQHPFDTCQWIQSCCAFLYDTHDVGLHIQFLFNGGPESQPIAGSMPVNCVRRWLNTTLTLTKRMILLHQLLQQSLDG